MRCTVAPRCHVATWNPIQHEHDFNRDLNQLFKLKSNWHVGEFSCSLFLFCRLMWKLISIVNLGSPEKLAARVVAYFYRPSSWSSCEEGSLLVDLTFKIEPFRVGMSGDRVKHSDNDYLYLGCRCGVLGMSVRRL